VHVKLTRAGLSAELVLLVGAMASIIFSTAGIIFILENLHFNEGAKFNNLFECIYFVVIVSILCDEFKRPIHPIHCSLTLTRHSRR
jgi:hypothetical protein